ncbi:DnaJ-domain-containing protein [Mollisia scopiformis]|uniref:DnaJ-domain-containing protein n=1 Tax=Mollisia scopiformis TaxID=149040 RepID=A0A194XIQ2_MOLSC|nr:DnaJ-domain-containing protein [Mollisia scopiformis]KUJ19642.1 DnaJ-domain-containing protein [Mollisia scopiformis]
MSAEQDHYAVLGLGHNASIAEIKTAFRKAALATHPDKGQREMTEAFVKVKAAYDVLRDDKTRAEFDQKLKKRINERSERGGPYSEDNFSSNEGVYSTQGRYGHPMAESSKPNFHPRAQNPDGDDTRAKADNHNHRYNNAESNSQMNYQAQYPRTEGRAPRPATKQKTRVDYGTRDLDEVIDLVRTVLASAREANQLDVIDVLQDVLITLELYTIRNLIAFRNSVRNLSKGQHVDASLRDLRIYVKMHIEWNVPK